MAKNLSLVDSLTTTVDIREERDDSGQTYHVARFLVSVADRPNANHRVYPQELLVREASNLKVGEVMGQAMHPYGMPNPLDQFLIWQKLPNEGPNFYGEARVVPTQPHGQNFIMLAKAGAKFTVSTRGRGSAKSMMMNGMECDVIQNDYRLEGIDVLYPGTQSTEGAYMLTFESKDKSMELTLEQLRTEHAELVEAVEAPLRQELDETKAKAQEQVTLSEAQVKELTDKVTALESQTAELQGQLSEKDAALQAKEESLKAESEAKEAAERRRAALAHLLEKAMPEKAAWLIVNELAECGTVEDVDAKFEGAVAHCNRLLETLSRPNYRAIADATEEGQDNHPAPEAQPAEPTALLKEADALARRYGL